MPRDGATTFDDLVGQLEELRVTCETGNGTRQECRRHAGSSFTHPVAVRGNRHGLTTDAGSQSGAVTRLRVLLRIAIRKRERMVTALELQTQGIDQRTAFSRTNVCTWRNRTCER